MIHPKKRFSLMPAVALATLAAVAGVPALSSSGLHAATRAHEVTTTVRSGDSIWTIAERTTPSGENVRDTVDAIVTTNRLGSGSIVPGQRLRIPIH